MTAHAAGYVPARCPNVPHAIALAVGRGYASLGSLGSELGVGDLYDVVEICAVDDYNRAQAARQLK